MHRAITLRLPRRYLLPLTYRLVSSLITHDFLPTISKSYKESPIYLAVYRTFELILLLPNRF